MTHEVTFTPEEVDFYWTNRKKLSPERLAVLAQYAAKFPHAERAYQERKALLVQTDKEIAAATRQGRK